MFPILYKGMLFGMPLSISAYWVMGLLAALTTIYASNKEFKDQNIKAHMRLMIVASVIVAFFIGARLYFVLLYWPMVVAKPHLILQFKLVNFGLYGGLIAAILTFVPFAKHTKLNFWKFCDHLTPYTAMAIAFSKLGCFLNGCCYGLPTSLPWGIYFPRAESTFIGQVISPRSLFSLITNQAIQLRHPTQVYEIIASLLALLIALYIVHYGNKGPKMSFSNTLKRPLPEGVLALSFASFFTFFRLIIFYFRDFPTATTMSQLLRGPITYGLVLMVLFYLVYKIRREY